MRRAQERLARACYDALIAHLPNTYYATLAQARLKTSDMMSAPVDPTLAAILQSLAWAARGQFPSFSPGPLVQKRVARAQLLLASDMHDTAENELKYGSRNEEGQTNVYAYELAKFAANHGAPDEALRYIKTFAPGYLYMPLDQAPVGFWRLAFPMPFRSSIEIHSREQGLDPYLVAALIRQESEFNPHALSPMNAHGLMQVMPATGKQLARHFGIRRFNATQLFTPDRNIQLGTYYFRELLDSCGGELEIALASYNAGGGAHRAMAHLGAIPRARRIHRNRTHSSNPRLYPNRHPQCRCLSPPLCRHPSRYPALSAQARSH